MLVRSSPIQSRQIMADLTQDLSQQRVPTLMQALRASKLINDPIVSYKLPRLTDGKRNTGEMTVGAMDPRHYDAQTLVRVANVNKFGFWGANVSAVHVGTHSMGWSRTVVMDTGTVRAQPGAISC